MPTLPRNQANSTNGSWPFTRTLPADGRKQPGDQVEGGRLAAAGLAEDRDQLAARDREAQALRTASNSPPSARVNDLLTCSNHDLRPVPGVGAHRVRSVGRAVERAHAPRWALMTPLHAEHEHDQHDGPGDRAGHVEDLLLLQELVADAAGRTDQLGHHHHARRVAEIDLPGGEDAGQHGRPDQRAKEVVARRPEYERHLEQVLRHRAVGVEHLERERRQRGHDHDEEDAELDAAKPDDRDHYPGQRRDALVEVEQRIAVALERVGARHQHGEHAAEHEGAGEPGEDAQAGRDRVVGRAPAGEDLGEARRDLRHRGKQAPAA